MADSYPSDCAARAAMSGLRPATPQQQLALAAAIDSLKAARALLRAADAPRSGRAVARAIKSAEGAARHRQRRIAS